MYQTQEKRSLLKKKKKKAVERVFLPEAIDHSAIYFLFSGREDFKALSINICYTMSKI